MHLHADKLDARQRIIDKCEMFFPEFPTIHVASFKGSVSSTRIWGTGSRTLKPVRLFHVRRHDLRERVPSPVQPGFYRSEIAVRDLGDLFVRLALQLPQDENVPVVLR